MEVFGCSLIRYIKYNQLGKTEGHTTRMYVLLLAKDYQWLHLSPKDLLAPAIDPQTKYIFPGMFGQQCPRSPKLLRV